MTTSSELAMSGPAIEAVDLRRVYTVHTGWWHRAAKKIVAVDGVSLTVARGEAFGLLGPNGAGKTTIIKMLNTLLLPTSGSARVLGYDVAREPAKVRRRIGYVFGGDRGLYDRLSAYDNLRYFAELYGLDPAIQRRRIPELLDRVGLTGREQERVEGYSRGMRQRLHIARGLLHEPEVLFLDEPSIGVDPAAARELRAMLRELCRQGTTILLTTHYMAEADEVCDRIAVLDKGRIQALGTPAEIKAAVADDFAVDLVVVNPSAGHVEALRLIPGVRSVHVEDGTESTAISVVASHGANVHAPVVAALGDIEIASVHTRQASLEDAYLALVESGLG
jgi:ABC-2 type transport system ATP-binding protein